MAREVWSTYSIVSSLKLVTVSSFRLARFTAIGAGLLVAEIQQMSNNTFRLSDWGRVDAQGNPRPLHIEQGRAGNRLHERAQLNRPVASQLRPLVLPDLLAAISSCSIDGRFKAEIVSRVRIAA